VYVCLHEEHSNSLQQALWSKTLFNSSSAAHYSAVSQYSATELL